MANKVEKVMREYKHGELHSGSKTGPKVKSRSQALAIALNEKREHGHQKMGKKELENAIRESFEKRHRAEPQKFKSWGNFKFTGERYD